MKASDSATSLTGLTSRDTGCFFCAEGDDPEGGKVLYHSKSVLGCGCDFSIHLSCWSQYLNKEVGHRPDCPVCKKPVIPTRIVEIYAPPAEKEKDPCSKSTALLMATVAAAFIVILILILYSTRAI